MSNNIANKLPNLSPSADKEVNFADEEHHYQITFSATFDNNLSLSDEDEESDTVQQYSGSLNKWTNYIHGWQKRYFILRGNTLAYYKSETETAFGCRGAISMCRAIIQPHEFDDCRFDVSLNDNTWYLRAENSDARQKWIEILETCKTESGYGSQNDLRRHGSIISLTSNRSLTSSSSFKNARGLKEKFAELETFRDIVCKQIETLQSYFDNCTEAASGSSLVVDSQTSAVVAQLVEKTLEIEDMENDSDPHDTPPCSALAQNVDKKMCSTSQSDYLTQKRRLLDFKGEALTFKATTSGILSTLQHCIDLMQQREEAWRRKLEKEVEKRKKAEDVAKHPANATLKQSRKTVVGPDLEEGPHSMLKEEEWHDAVDAALERQDIEDRRVSRLLCREPESPVVKMFDRILLSREHRFYDEIDSTLKEQVSYAKSGVEDGVWQLFAEDGEMKMYKREVEIDGLVCDPLKAVHSVKGVTAREYLHYFYEPEYKMDWDTTLEAMNVVEKPSDDTSVIHQVHKRVWPASQRESLFWSHFRRLQPTSPGNNHSAQRNFHLPPGHQFLDCYVVCNHDTEHPNVSSTKNIRVGLTVAMVCQTVTDDPKAPLSSLKRDNLTTKVIYVAQVNPGGWAPSSVLRAVYKREYPRFLKRFTQYVLQKVEGTNIRF